MTQPRKHTYLLCLEVQLLALQLEVLFGRLEHLPLLLHARTLRRQRRLVRRVVRVVMVLVLAQVRMPCTNIITRSLVKHMGPHVSCLRARERAKPHWRRWLSTTGSRISHGLSVHVPRVFTRAEGPCLTTTVIRHRGWCRAEGIGRTSSSCYTQPTVQPPLSIACHTMGGGPVSAPRCSLSLRLTFFGCSRRETAELSREGRVRCARRVTSCGVRARDTLVSEPKTDVASVPTHPRACMGHGAVPTRPLERTQHALRPPT